MKPKILIVDDEQLVLNALNRELKNEFDVLLSLSGHGALQILREQGVSVILSDQRMPEMTGVEMLAESRTIQPHAKRILLTGYSDRDAMMDAINSGNIFHYIQKPWEPAGLKQLLMRAVDLFDLERENERLTEELKKANNRLESENIILKKEVESHYTFDSIVGDSPAMEAVFHLMKKVIPTDVTVIIQGETGTGKELVAKAIHFNGPRKNHVFAAQNCGAIPDTLLESTLFGHKKGAFTDAVKDHKGLFEVADGGTVFLDEVGEMSPGMQQRLLRVLQEGEIQPVGDVRTRKVDVRVISATNVDLKNAVQNRTFREDLYFRLHVMPIDLPPLRERKEDIPALVGHFIEKNQLLSGESISGVSPDAIQQLNAYDYPGNVRELENIVSRTVLLLDGDVIQSFQVNVPTVKVKSDLAFDEDMTLPEAVNKLEYHMIIKTLEKTGGNISRTANLLGVSRMGLYKMIKRLNLK